jgi:hypothetical protein
MPRYLVQRSFPDGLRIPIDDNEGPACGAITSRNAEHGVTWVHSYVSDDRTRMFCIYDAPSPEAIRITAARNGLPVERITRVTVLDPYAYARTGDAVRSGCGPL